MTEQLLQLLWIVSGFAVGYVAASIRASFVAVKDIKTMATGIHNSLSRFRNPLSDYVIIPVSEFNRAFAGRINAEKN